MNYELMSIIRTSSAIKSKQTLKHALDCNGIIFQVFILVASFQDLSDGLFSMFAERSDYDEILLFKWLKTLLMSTL